MIALMLALGVGATEPLPTPGPLLQPIGGRILARGTRQSVSGAALLSGDEEPLAVTDEDGRFHFELPPGEHLIEIRAGGHLPTEEPITVSKGEALELLIRLTPLAIDPYETTVRAAKPRTSVTRIELERAEVRETAGTLGDPLRAVMLMPGVAGLGSGVAYPVVRGLQPAATGFFVDGVRVPLLFHLLLGPSVVHPELVDGLIYEPGLAPLQHGRLLGGSVEARLPPLQSERLRVVGSVDLINAHLFIQTPIEPLGLHVAAAGRLSYTGLIAGALVKALSDRL